MWFPVEIGFCANQKQWDIYIAKCGIDPLTYRYPELDRPRGGTFSSFAGFGSKPDSYTPFGLVTLSDPMDEWEDPTSVMGVIIHESVHAFQFILERAAEKEPSAEFMAYGIQFISEFMIRSFSELRWQDGKKKKSKAKTARATPRKNGPRDRSGVPGVGGPDPE